MRGEKTAIFYPLQHSALRKRHRGIATHDDVIDDLHVDECERFLEVLGQEPIGGTRFGDPAWMVMGEYDATRPVFDCLTDNLARIDAGLGPMALP